MSSLLELQQQFIRGLRSESNEILHSIDNKKLTAQDHLNIYRGSIIGTLQKALKEIFPVCLKLVGEKFFIAMINDYIETTPSSSPDIGNYGKQFAEFVRDFDPAKTLPYLSDVARLEWAWHSIFNAPDHPIFNFEKLKEYSEIASNRIVFCLPPESHLITSPFPIHRIWEVNQEDYKGDQTVIIDQYSCYYFLVWRNNLDMQIDELTRYNWNILNCFQQDLTVEEICTNFAEEVDIIEVLPELVQKGWLVDFHLKI